MQNVVFRLLGVRKVDIVKFDLSVFNFENGLLGICDRAFFLYTSEIRSMAGMDMAINVKTIATIMTPTKAALHMT